MKKIIAVAILSILGSTAYAGNDNAQHHTPTPVTQPNIQGQGQAQGQLQGQLQLQESTAISSSSSDSSSKSISGSNSSAEGGDSNADSQSNNAVSISGGNDFRKYPEIPVNAGATFASVCQEGSSSTGSKVSIALTTDSAMCNHLRLADTYLSLYEGYSKACNKDIDDQTATWRHATLVASQVKGSVKVPDLEIKPSDECSIAGYMQHQMLHELKQAQDVNDKTHTTGILAKWATQLGIPVTVLYVLGAAL